MPTSCALVLVLGLVQQCAAFALTPKAAMRWNAAVVQQPHSLALVKMEEGAEEEAAPAPAPAYEPTEAEISEFMRNLPRLDWQETVATKRARAIQHSKGAGGAVTS